MSLTRSNDILVLAGDELPSPTRISSQPRVDVSASMRCAITALAELLARKQQLLERLQADPDPQERNEIERLLGEINLTLELLDEPGESRSEP
ncbi:hypothetical protein [Bradyrhizobium sp.]|uniref:hypothetical protein n=1 Tax=Bradyrhizobium sp. TaxID=376 RepID=UPI003C4E8020